MYLILKQLYFMNRLPVVMPMEFLLYCLILKKMADRGTAVIVIKSNIEYMHGISDRVFIIE